MKLDFWLSLPGDTSFECDKTDFYSFLFNCRKRQMELNMMKMIWKIDIDDIELQKPKYGTGSRVCPLRKHAHDCKKYNFQMKSGDIFLIFLIFTQNI